MEAIPLEHQVKISKIELKFKIYLYRQIDIKNRLIVVN